MEYLCAVDIVGGSDRGVVRLVYKRGDAIV